MTRLAAAFAAMLLAGCSDAATAAATRPSWTAVLVAGDDSLPVFDDAVNQMGQRLAEDGAVLQRFSAAHHPGTRLATRARVLDAIAALHPAAGGACFVFLTSHGAQGRGLYLSPREEFLSPADLDGALRAGCGSAPTLAIVSACYSGGFAQPPMRRPNRVLITAARADRSSFGCGAGRELTYFDGCLLQALAARPSAWQGVVAGSRACVAKLEAQDGEPASDPQSFLGENASVLPSPP